MHCFVTFNNQFFCIVSEGSLTVENYDELLLIAVNDNDLLSLIAQEDEVFINHCDNFEVGVMIDGELQIMWHMSLLPDCVLIWANEDMVKIFTDFGYPFDLGDLAEISLQEIEHAALADMDLNVAMQHYRGVATSPDFSSRSYALYLLIQSILPPFGGKDNGDFA